MRTAGKITVVAAVTGLLVFMVAFIFNVGTQQLSKVSAAGNATTTLTVLNTPPAFTVKPYEVIGSSTSTPTNSSGVIQWAAVGTDANGADYFLLICSTNASPTPNNEDAPDCGGGAQWGVSATTTSGALATVSTTTATTTGAAGGTGQFAEINNWYAWVCDADPVDPRCVTIAEQGDYATSSSPFNVNNRPIFTNFYNNGPANPGATFNFLSTTTDPDLVGGEDNIKLVVCGTASYNTTTNTCNTNFIASTTVNMLSNANATYTLPAIIRDQAYGAYGYLVDEHGHEAYGNGRSYNFVVRNVAPVVFGTDIILSGDGTDGTKLVLSIPGGQTPSSTLDFTITDANSCLNAASSSEITNFTVAVFRASYGTTTCNGTAGSYNPNFCYPSGVATTTWNLSCQTTNICASPLQDHRDYSCTFPLWFVADPTDAAANIPATLAADIWSAGVSGSDNNFATGTMATTSNPQELKSFSSLDILAAEIVYGGIEPGDDTGTLSATSTLLNVGNTALDQEAIGDSMCGTYTPSNTCDVSATTTIPSEKQQFASTSIAYDLSAPYPAGLYLLSSTTAQEVELNVKKSTTTSLLTVTKGVTYWGIAVPISITLAGSYTGMNTFTAVAAEAGDWY